MEMITVNDMNQLSHNQQFIFEQMPRANYRGFGVHRSEGIKLAAGLIAIGASKKPYASNDVRFGNFFAPRCNPIVTTGIVASHQHRIFCTIQGLGTLHPDNRGFRARVTIDAATKKNRKIARNFYVSWQALGY